MANTKAPTKGGKTADKTNKSQDNIKAKPIGQGKKPAPGVDITQTVPAKAAEKGAAPATA